MILKDQVPRNSVMEVNQSEQEQTAADEDVFRISSRLLENNGKAYADLAK